ncbi:MAG: bifunctional phosphopantothenoylcysteine decarboxylase/phosphopantothenate--cysteine ligase CoaBC [Syntrophomonadaceae bacterium]|nr:bifunctional phosphopantothenoylcysteine decarboxylase/phosphopantothenate--cysteine ligase CoaBC [Syntrophomonadaceae bacterium]MDD3888330.1 bifunctional phosphopantothenoylcysteine decarboxylase/phosphopantothenate--cysteine ligase CoaBC [Syntrophomonadaceae bacterium]MDD4548837.1 bifunctional phosphopantothenoylcysteine decarboxylase/phosphopantothenate--cysteine ligase CoaBC [Syntrophomonadaceae bacterium]
MSKTVGIGITGSIAAYKIADLVSKLKKDGVDVIVIMTEAATRFISPLTFKTLTGREVLTDLWQESPEWKVQHIGIAEQLDALVIAPATANFIAKMAHGIADDLLSTIVLANTSPILVVPAMNNNMYKNFIVQDNIKKLIRYGYKFMDPTSGLLACGTSGQGRLPEVDDIHAQITKLLFPQKDLLGKRLMVNAGTTCEDIDPVRFIANRATGKMGYRIAEEAVSRGADVILVSGNSTIEPPSGVKFETAWSADEMCQVMLKYQPACDIIIGAAAVGDFQITGVAGQKLKKVANRSDKLVLEFVGTPDILQELGKRKAKNQIIVGFAAETENIIENAKLKLEKKNLDFIVANDVTMEGAGFATDTNIVTIITRNGEVQSLPKMSKEDVAAALLDKVVDLLKI